MNKTFLKTVSIENDVFVRIIDLISLLNINGNETNVETLVKDLGKYLASKNENN